MQLLSSFMLSSWDLNDLVSGFNLPFSGIIPLYQQIFSSGCL